MKYQFDWQQQLQAQMAQMPLAQGIPEAKFPAYLTLYPDFFPTPAAAKVDPATTNAAYEGQRGCSVHINVPRS